MSGNRLIDKEKQTGTTERKTGSGKLRTAKTEENKPYVKKLIASQKECPGTHKSQRQIKALLQVSRRSVQGMTKDLNFKAFKRNRVSRRDSNVGKKHTKLNVGTSMTRCSNKEVKKWCSRMRTTSRRKLLATNKMTGSKVHLKSTSLQFAFIMNPAALQKNSWFPLVSAGMI